MNFFLKERKVRGIRISGSALIFVAMANPVLIESKINDLREGLFL